MRKATFEHSINVLVKAYLNDTLVQGNCYACAVGNLVKDAMGYTYTQCIDAPDKKIALKENEGLYGKKDSVGDNWYQAIVTWSNKPFFQRESEAIGYNIEEIIKIEAAFELRMRDDQFEEDTVDNKIFKGLMAVVDVLAEIHGIDLETRESTKKLFNKELQLN